MDSLQKIFTKEIIKDIYTKEVMKNVNTEEIVKDNHSNEPSQNTISYSNPNLDYALIRKEALIVAKPSTNNKIGVHNEYYTRHVEPKIIKGEFPYTISTPPLKENQEYKDFLNLVKILKSYKIKPLFIMQDQSPLAFVYNRKSMEPLLMNIKTELNKYGYGYLDMWTYNPKDYVLGTLTDIMHMGELGWVDVDKKIIEHFMSGEKDED
jgi:D-alanine transfer protein